LIYNKEQIVWGYYFGAMLFFQFSHVAPKVVISHKRIYGYNKMEEEKNKEEETDFEINLKL
jgi:hypothetical protein